MILIATALLLLVKAEITNFTYCQYSYANCTNELLCQNLCETNQQACQLYSCAQYRTTYKNEGMSEYGVCYTSGGQHKMISCIETEPLVCSDYDICHVYCTSRNLQCEGPCYLQYVQNLNGSYDCDDEELISKIESVHGEFKEFNGCFNNTKRYKSGEDYSVVCNLGSSSKTINWGKIIIPIVSITAVYCCIWYVWRRSEAEEKNFWRSKLSLTSRTNSMEKTKDTVGPI